MDLFTVIQTSFGFFLLILIRMSGIFIMAPIFGSRNIPLYAKIGLSFTFSMVLFPMVFQGDVDLPANFFLYVMLLIGEFFVGWIIGFVSSFVFSAVQMAGQVIDMQIGFGMVNVMDPQSGQQIPLIGNFKYILALLVFLTSNSHHLLLAALFDSFQLVPVSKVVVYATLTGVIVDMVWGLFSIAMKIALPIVVSVLLTDIALGMLARTMPQMNVFVVGMPLKIIVGMFVLSLVVPFYILFLEVAFNDMFQDIYRVLDSLG